MSQIQDLFWRASFKNSCCWSVFVRVISRPLIVAYGRGSNIVLTPLTSELAYRGLGTKPLTLDSIHKLKEYPLSRFSAPYLRGGEAVRTGSVFMFIWWQITFSRIEFCTISESQNKNTSWTTVFTKIKGWSVGRRQSVYFSNFPYICS